MSKKKNNIELISIDEKGEIKQVVPGTPAPTGLTSGDIKFDELVSAALQTVFKPKK